VATIINKSEKDRRRDRYMARRIKKDEETEAYEWRGLVSYRRGAIRAIKRRTNKRERREGRAEAQDTTRPDMTPEGNESSPDDQR